MLGTKFVKNKIFLFKNCIVVYEYYKSYFYCFAQLYTLSLRFENNLLIKLKIIIYLFKL